MHFLFWLRHNPFPLWQIGDVAVIDISAKTIDLDESNIKNIPSAESKGLLCAWRMINWWQFFLISIIYEHFKHELYILYAGFHFDTDDGNKVLPGFLDSIIGIRPGETKSFPLVFPETWKQENLRGVQAQFTVSFVCCKCVNH